MASNLTRDHVPDDDALGVAIDDYEIKHFGAGIHLDLPSGNLRAERLVGAKEKLLAGLPSGIEGPRDLRAAEGAVCQEATVLARKGNPLCNALVDDRGADFGQAVNIGFARPKVTALDGVVEETITLSPSF